MILNNDFISTHITVDKFETINLAGDKVLEYTPVPYRWTHGATEKHLGDGILIYSIIQLMKYKTLVCLGSGGGYIPRIMTQARIDLYDQDIFEGDRDYNWGDIGVTYLVDAANGVGGKVSYLDKNSYFRYQFCPRFINSTTEEAYYDFFVKQDIKIDFLHIDAGHSYEDVKQDFELYSNQLSDFGIISIHDTDTSYEKEHIVTNDVLEQNHHDEYVNGPAKLIEELKENNDWEIFNFFNNGIFKSRPSSTGLTFVQRCKK